MIVAKEEDGAVSMSEIVLGAQGWVVLLYHYEGFPQVRDTLRWDKGNMGIYIYIYVWFRG